jgi:hypothetical protein
MLADDEVAYLPEPSGDAISREMTRAIDKLCKPSGIGFGNQRVSALANR